MTQTQNDTNPNGKGDLHLSWSAPKTMYHEHSRRWYIVAGIVTGLLLLYSLLTAAWSFTFVIVVCAVLYVYAHKEPPQMQTIAIHQHGIQIGETFTPWLDCNGFWIVQTPAYSLLYIQRKSGLDREPHVLLENVEPLNLRLLLSTLLPELPDRHERLLDTILRVCKL